MGTEEDAQGGSTGRGLQHRPTHRWGHLPDLTLPTTLPTGPWAPSSLQACPGQLWGHWVPGALATGEGRSLELLAVSHWQPGFLLRVICLEFQWKSLFLTTMLQLLGPRVGGWGAAATYLSPTGNGLPPPLAELPPLSHLMWGEGGAWGELPVLSTGDGGPQRLAPQGQSSR